MLCLSLMIRFTAIYNVLALDINSLTPPCAFISDISSMPHLVLHHI